MRISQKTAMNIVKELKQIINYDLTFMDTSCYIVACTDETRIGDFHGATHRMMREGLDELVVKTDQDYEGTHAGVNFALEIDGEMIGVIGITGEYESVGRYGQIIKKMTEILLLEDSLREQKHRERGIRNQFVQEWISMNEMNLNKDFMQQGRTIGIDIQSPRYIAVIVPDKECLLLDQDMLDRIDAEISDLLPRHSGHIWANIGRNFIALLNVKTQQQALRLAQKIFSGIRDRCGVTTRIGIDNQPVSGSLVQKGYFRADKAAHSAVTPVNLGVVFYDEILLELFLYEISEASKKSFVDRIFKNCTEREIEESVKLLQTLYEANGSITQTAEKLYLHKNTVQYKLIKIHEKTGYDPRKLYNVPLFYMAMRFFNEDSRSATGVNSTV